MSPSIGNRRVWSGASLVVVVDVLLPQAATPITAVTPRASPLSLNLDSRNTLLLVFGRFPSGTANPPDQAPQGGAVRSHEGDVAGLDLLLYLPSSSRQAGARVRRWQLRSISPLWYSGAHDRRRGMVCQFGLPRMVLARTGSDLPREVAGDGRSGVHLGLQQLL